MIKNIRRFTIALVLLPIQFTFAAIEEIDNSTMEAVAADLKAALEDSRFRTEEGSFNFSDPKFCEKVAEQDLGANCFGQNPLSPYGLVSLPESDNIIHPDAVKPLADSAPEGEQLIWHLQQTDAVVMLGLTPPEHRYYSFTPYVMSRYKPLNNLPLFNEIIEGTSIKFVLGTSINEGHRDVFNSVIPAINNVNILSEPADAADHNLEYTAIILSPDKGTMETVKRELRRVLYRHNISVNIINTLPLPSDILHLGEKSRDDTFTILSRMAFLSNPEDEELMNAYTNNPPMKVMRVSGTPLQRHQPAEAIPFPERAQGWSEDYVEEELQGLIGEVKKHFLDNGYALQDESQGDATKSKSIEGVRGLKLGYGTLGDSPDAIYVPASRFQLDHQDDVVAYIGINHAEITAPNDESQSKSVYSNLTTYLFDNLGAVNSISDQELFGTALPFSQNLMSSPSENHLYSKVFYVGILANDCSLHDFPNCRDIGALQDLKYRNGDNLLTIERAYIRADGDTQNEYEELRPVTQLVFDGPDRD